MNDTIRTCTIDELTEAQLLQYKASVRSAFPDIIFQSEVVKNCWPTIEKYFPEFQLFILDANDSILGFLNSIPIFWDQSLSELPDEGWDWLVRKGIDGYDNNVKPNCIGGLQIIVCKEHLGKGYSKILIAEGKKIKEKLSLDNFIIPIRPTFKSKFPEMDMKEYINFKPEKKIYDPWIRVHIGSGAKIIKICPKAMHIFGNIKMWEKLKGQKILKSGIHLIEGALTPVSIDLENDFGEYFEDNIWINH